MKFNQWTLGLAAVGVVSLTSVAQAEEKLSSLTAAAVASTTISGYVDTSIQWNPGTQTKNGTLGSYPSYSYGGANKADGFNLNVVQLTISKALDEGEWASGYRADLWFGPDANSLATTSAIHDQAANENTDVSADLAIRQAYVALRTPIGNGIDWKIGVFDTIIGYETHESGNNPNYTRSYGYSIEPTTHTGLLGTYRICDMFSVSAGIANTKGPHINARAHGEDGKAESSKTYMGSIAFTAPDSWGWAKGSSIYAGVVDGFDDNDTDNGLNQGSDIEERTTSWYLGATFATPVAGLKVGAAFDALQLHNANISRSRNDIWTLAIYGSYQATEKMSVHLRGEFIDDHTGDFIIPNNIGRDNTRIYALTGTVQYDLWKNVISRLEVRWDHSDNGKIFGAAKAGGEGAPSDANAVVVAANVIYKF